MSGMTTAEVPPERRLESQASCLVHIRSPWTSAWKATGTPLCNDAKQLDVTPDADPSLPVCRRCASAYSRELGRPPHDDCMCDACEAHWAKA